MSWRRRPIRGVGAVPLSEAHPDAVFFVCAERPDGSCVPVGTCFLVGVPGDEGRWWRYFVTAAHVVMNGEAKWIRFRRSDGAVVDQKVGEWISHPTADAAATPCDPALLQVPGIIARFVEDTWWADRWAEHVPVPLRIGEEAYFVGLLWDVPTMAERNIPMVRSGRVGAYFQRDIPMVSGSVHRMEPVAHLLDSYSRAGFSGSPCFVDVPVVNSRPDLGGNALAIGSKVALLGMVIGHFGTEGANEGIAVVTPIEAVRELIEKDPALRQWRETMDKEAARMREEERKEAGGAIEDAVGGDDQTEYERFEDLTRQLANTPKPKPEVDES